jgi:hypothetical protein
MSNTHTPDRTITTLSAAVIDELDRAYTLVHAEGELPKDLVAALVQDGEPWTTKGGESLEGWAQDIARDAAHAVVDELAREIVLRWEREDSTDDVDADVDADYSDLIDNEWPYSDERGSAVDAVHDRDTSTWFDDMVKGHGAVLLRVGIPAMSEDAGLSFTPITYEAFLDLLGFEHTEHNLTTAAEVVDNASPEFTVVMGYAMLGVDLADIVALPSEGKVELRNPHVWFGSPFTGSGWCGDEPFHGTLIVDREDLRTDEDAFGYSWGDVVGGTSASYFTGGSLALVKQPAPAVSDTHNT